MWPCGALQLHDLKVGQVIRWRTDMGNTSVWILLDEETPRHHATLQVIHEGHNLQSDPTSRRSRRSFKLWCVASYDYGAGYGCKPGVTTTYEFDHCNISGFELISDVKE